MKIGTYYYPEQWPRDQWERDFDNITKMGLQIVHLAEFAWYDLEPKPGEFQFEWLEHCLAIAQARNLDVILCTPTAAPPIWLSHKVPQILPITQHGTPVRHGGRRHYNPLSPEFQAATRRIVHAMAEKFGNHSSVIGWQIDNEYSSAFDQSPTTHAAFRKWLRDRYGDIAKLNQAWGNQFWTTYYTDFDQIFFPPSRDPRYGNPHHMLDASRFWSWAFAVFNQIQTDILRPKIGSRFLTTNFMQMMLDVDPGDMARDLTLTSWDSYPVTGWEKKGDDQTYRIADPSSIGLEHDVMASYQKRWALMELQPGQVNWSNVPVRVYPNAIRLWIWTAFAHGAEFVTTYRFRQPRFGIELFHHGLVGTDGITPSRGGQEFMQAIEEMRRLDLTRVPKFADEPMDLAGTVGLVFDFEQLWYFASLPQARRWNQTVWLISWYSALSRLGVRVTILRPGAEWPEGLKLVVAPSVQMIDEALVTRFHDYVEDGGNLVLTCRTALMDRTGQLWEGPTAAPILSLIGASIDGYDSLRDDRFGKIEFAGESFDWGVWADQLTASPGTEVLGTYRDQFYRGAAAITQKTHGRGTVSYFGVFSEQPLVDAFVRRLAGQIGLLSPRNQSGVTNAILPERVQILRRGSYRIALNYQDKPVEIETDPGARFVIGSRKLGPADIAVWEDA